jgi:predicted HAD superfamily Cof-like phosphohydrolase
MIKQLKSVEEFHIKFKQTNGSSPCMISEKEAELRHKIMVEEVDEYMEAVKENDLIGIADALGDQLYILCGTILKHGMQDVIEKVFDEIHASNLSKLDENGEPVLREDGKIIKGPYYHPPDIMGIINPF